MSSKQTSQSKAKQKPEESKPKRRNYKKELEVALKETAELKDKLLRTAAEFDNYRKRVANERGELIANANADLVASLLPVLDDIDRFAKTDTNGDVESFRQGFEMIAKKLHKTLSDYGLREMQSVGQPFDPEKHDALMQVEAEKTESDIVVEEHEKGYEFNGRVLRHAKVIVSK